MSQKHQKLTLLLKELFQLDQPDLDFGIYRVLHAKSAEVSQFLDKDLLPQVQAAFGQYKTADKAELEKELSKVIADIEAAEMDPEGSPKVKDLRDRIKSDAADIDALEAEVYDQRASRKAGPPSRRTSAVVAENQSRDRSGHRRPPAEQAVVEQRTGHSGRNTAAEHRDTESPRERHEPRRRARQGGDGRRHGGADRESEAAREEV